MNTFTLVKGDRSVDFVIDGHKAYVINRMGSTKVDITEARRRWSAMTKMGYTRVA